MTTEESKKVVIALMDCQRNKDIEGFKKLVTDDFYVRVPGHAELLPWRTEVKGKEQYIPYLMELSKFIRIDKVERTKVIAEGDTVVAIVKETLTILKHNKQFSLDEIWVFTVLAGKVKSIIMCEDTITPLAMLRGIEVKDI